MFDWFGKRSSRQNSIRTCTALATDAQIDVVLEAGNYAGFLIRIDTDGGSLAVHFQHPEARSAFVGAVEERIRAGHFNDPGRGIDLVAEGRELTGWKPNTNVLRAVIGAGDRSLFNWDPP
jgi:hypothetical protein